MARADFEQIQEADFAQALAKYQKVATVDVKFRQEKFLKDMALAITSEGELHLKLPDQVVYRLVKPSRLVVTITAKEIILETGSAPDAKIQKIATDSKLGDTETRNLKAMVNWLKLDPVALAHDDQIATDHKGHFRFRPLAPETSPFRELMIELGSNGYLKQVVMNEQSGDHITFFFETPQITYAPKSK